MTQEEVLNSLYEILLRISSAGDIILLPIDDAASDTIADGVTGEVAQSLADLQPAAVLGLTYIVTKDGYTLEISTTADQARKLAKGVVFAQHDMPWILAFLWPEATVQVTNISKALVILNGDLENVVEWRAPEDVIKPSGWGKGWGEPD